MATARDIESAAREPKPVIGGAVFGLDSAALHDAKVTADSARWARRCVRRHVLGGPLLREGPLTLAQSAAHGLLCDVLGIGET